MEVRVLFPALWQANGRQLPVADSGLTISTLIAMYYRHCQGYYGKGGETVVVRAALKPLRELYGSTLAQNFGPLALQSVRDQMIERGCARKYINKQVNRIRRMFQWAVALELIPPQTHQALKSVTGLRQGKSAAREKAPIGPVDDEVIEATLEYCSPTIAAMIRLQALTGMRPGELFAMRPCDVDRSGPTWLYTPAQHKTQHLGREIWSEVVFLKS